MTRAGWLFLTISVLVGLAAVRGQAPLTYVLFGGMMGALHVSAILARRMINGVRVRREAPARVWQNRTVHVGLLLQEQRRRPALALSLQSRGDEYVESARGYCAYLPVSGSFRAGTRFAARRRGRVRLGELRLSTVFPFGLVEAYRRIESEQDIVVWPARGRLRRRLLLRGAMETSSSAPSPASGGQDEFFGLREYRDGDHPRWIHWRRSAGRAFPVIREMSRPLPEILWVILDPHFPDLTGSVQADRERILRFAATLIDHALTRGYQVGLALAGPESIKVLAPGAGRGHRCELLDALADAGEPGRPVLEQTLDALRRGQLKAAQVVVVGPRLDRLARKRVASLRAACRDVRLLDSRRLEQWFEDDALSAGATGDAT